MRIFLVRHGESEGNVDRSVYLTKPDHAIRLSARGKLQSISAGLALNRFRKRDLGITYPIRRVWVSPYERTRQTFVGMQNGALDYCDSKESIHLVEQQYGLFDGIPDEDLPKVFPVEHAFYKKSEDFEGRFWARMPLGESRFDVCQRVHQFFGSLHRDLQQNGIDEVAIVAHGVTIRAFVMMYCNKPWEWFEAAPNPKNCSIRLIEDGQDCGLIYTGGTDEPERISEAVDD